MSKTLIPLFLATSILAHAAVANDVSPVKLVEPITTLTGHDGIIADVQIEAGAALPLHQHPGDEFLYMLTGSVELSRPDQPALVLQAGDAYRIPAGTIHSPKGGPEGARAIVFRVHPSGEPVTVQVNE